MPGSDGTSVWGQCRSKIGPGNNRSADKSSHTNQGNPWLRRALTECTQGASKKKNCVLKDEFWSVTTKPSGKRAPAVMAVAHNPLRFVFRVLSTGKPYRERSAPLEPQQRERMIRHHLRRLGKPGIAAKFFWGGASPQMRVRLVCSPAFQPPMWIEL